MSLNKKIIPFYLLVFIIVLCTFFTTLSAGEKITNIIFMVPDGTSLSNVVAARIYAYGIGDHRLSFEKLEEIGYQATSSKNSVVTDSAAAASAWACGEKFNNGEISFHRETGTFPESILELSQGLGKSTGLVATSTITHATPAAFGAHIDSRKYEDKIARYYIEKTGVDVILGGGQSKFSDDLIEEAKAKGYKYVTAKTGLEKVVKNVQSSKEKVLGLFSKGALTPVHKRPVESETNEPTLVGMTKAALAILEKNDKGFFLMVEGSQVDWGNHQNDRDYMIAELLAFDHAVQAVLDWISQDKSRIEGTLLIVVPDHGCGGYAITAPYGSLLQGPGHYVGGDWLVKGHTAEDTMIWSQGPCSQFLGKAIDNTDVFKVMKAALFAQNYHPQNKKPFRQQDKK